MYFRIAFLVCLVAVVHCASKNKAMKIRSSPVQHQPSSDCTQKIIDDFSDIQDEIHTFLTSDWKKLNDRLESNENFKNNAIIVKMCARFLLPPHFHHFDHHDIFKFRDELHNTVDLIDGLLPFVFGIFGKHKTTTTTTPRPHPNPHPRCSTDILVSYVLLRKYALLIFREVMAMQVKPAILYTDTSTPNLLTQIGKVLTQLGKKCNEFLITHAGASDLAFVVQKK